MLENLKEFLHTVNEGWIKGKPYLIDRTMIAEVLSPEGPRYWDKVIGFVDESRTDVCKRGYVEARGFLRELKFTGTRCYMKLSGFQCFDVWDGYAECENKDDWPYYTGTSGTIHDYYTSKAEAKFKRGFSKIRMSTINANWTTIGIIAIAALVAAFFLTGVF